VGCILPILEDIEKYKEAKDNSSRLFKATERGGIKLFMETILCIYKEYITA
jgi:hypothetical protein